MRQAYLVPLLALAACDKSPPATVPSPAASTAPIGAPNLSDADAAACAGPAVTREVTFASSDYLIVHGTFSTPCGATLRPIVVLAHQFCKDRTEWSRPPHDWVSAFGKRGIPTLAIDLRGHGASKEFPPAGSHDLCAETSAPAALFAGMPDDVKAAMSFARWSLHAPEVAVIGASIGSNSAIVAFAGDPKAVMVVALSPGLDYKGITIESAIKSIGARPALLEAAADDKASADAVTKLKTANANLQTQVWPAGGHANAMIDAHPEELARIADLVASKLVAAY